MNRNSIIKMAEEILHETGELPLSPSAGYLLAVSGGRDSMLLLYFFMGLAESGLIKKPGIFHFHHRLRSAASDDMNFVRSISDEFALFNFTVRKNIGILAKRLGLTLEETGRLFRYRYLRKICRSHNYDYAVTGHQADDYVESILIHMIRGGGKNSLQAMNRYERIEGLTIFRPLLTLNRDRIDYYIDRYQIPYREDESNVSELFLRNRIRKNVLPQLKKEGLNPSHLWKNFHDGFDELWKSSGKTAEVDRIILDRNFFEASSPDIIKNILDTSLRRLSLSPVTLGILHEISRQISTGPGRLHVITGRYILWASGAGPVWLFRRDSQLLKPFYLEKKNNSDACAIHYGGCEKSYILSDEHFVTVRKDGMRMDIKGGSKKIKKILQESHIPVEIRDCIPIIANRNTSRAERICFSLIEGYKDRVAE